MEDSRSKQIDESKDELLILVKHHVEEVLHEYYLKHGIKANYDIRDDAVLYVFELAHKKGHNNSKFQEMKGQYIRVMAKSYLFSKYLDKSE
jgi:hypothetical protein